MLQNIKTFIEIVGNTHHIITKMFVRIFIYTVSPEFVSPAKPIYKLT